MTNCCRHRYVERTSVKVEAQKSVQKSKGLDIKLRAGGM